MNRYSDAARELGVFLHSATLYVIGWRFRRIRNKGLSHSNTTSYVAKNDI